MPTYEYECQKCGHHFDAFQSMKDAKLTDCPQETCDGAVKRLLGRGAGLIFKGSGFYETDYRSASYKEGARKAEEASKGTESKAEGTSPGKSDSGKSKDSGTPSKPAAAASKD